MKPQRARVIVVTEDDHLFERLRDAVPEVAGVPVPVERRSSVTEGGERELERLRHSHEEFLYHVSHDLRQPLHVVAGYLELLEIRGSEQFDADMLRMLNRTTSSVERLQAMLDGLLSLSRVRQDRANPRAIDLGEVLDEVVVALSARLEGSGASVRRDRLPVVQADPAMVRQLWSCLLENSLAHGGAEAPRVQVHWHREAGEEHLAFVDNGPGIDPDDLERVFGVFQRGVGGTGTGLGLALVRRIVELHGGRAWAEVPSTPGAAIHFTLPVACGPSGAPRVDSEEST